MPPRFDISLIKSDPRAPWKWALALLVVGNLAAFFLLVKPIWGSAGDLEEQLSVLRADIKREQAQLVRLRSLVAKVEKARAGQ